MSGAEMDARAARRFPQPVRAGLLPGRDLLAPMEWQPVLGRIAGLSRGSDGRITVLVRLDGRLGLGWLGLRWIDWPGFGPRVVGVPVEAVALLGGYVGLMDLTPEQLQALPSVASDAAQTIGPDETVRIGLTAPFH